jgi:hypothetical protein
VVLLLLLALGLLPWIAAEYLQRHRPVLALPAPGAPEHRYTPPPFDVDDWVHEQRHQPAAA